MKLFSKGTKVIERAIDMVHSYVTSEFWQIGKLLTMPDGLFFINDGVRFIITFIKEAQT